MRKTPEGKYVSYSELFEDCYGNGRVTKQYVMKIFKDHGLGKIDFIEFVEMFGDIKYYTLNPSFQMYLGY